MELLLILTYVAICVAIFKAFRIPLNKWTVPTAALGGVVIIGTLFMVMNYNHPYAEVTRQYYATTPMMVQLRGRVIEVPVQPNTPVSAGDVLFRLDPEPFENDVEGLEGELVAARKDLDRAVELFSSAAASERMVDQTRSLVDELEAKLDDAQFDLEQSVVHAPSDGVVTSLVLRPGMMALPMRPVLTFLHKEEGIFVGWFRQNSLLRLEKGNDAEITLDAIPGVIFKAEVDHLLPVIAEGQLQPSGDFVRYDPQQMPGRVAVALRIVDPAFEEYKLPRGVLGQAAILTEHFHHVAMLRRILLRMAAWMNYVFPLH